MVFIIAPKITPDIYEINWNNLTSLEVYNRYRALYGFKALTSKFQQKSIELLDISLPQEISAGDSFKSDSSPGSLVYHYKRKCLRVQCANHTFIEVHRLRVEGKKAMSAMDFNNGFLKKLQTSKMEFHYNKVVCC